MSKAKTNKVEQYQYIAEPGRSKGNTSSGRPRNRKPKFLRGVRPSVITKKKEKTPRPNKQKPDRAGQWRCICGHWNVLELIRCEECDRENPKDPGKADV